MKINNKTKWEEKYLDLYTRFIEDIIDWNPDFIVPTARKSCKLFGSLPLLFNKIKDRIYYREYFKFKEIDLAHKKIAIVDDAVQRTSTLMSYRKFFLEEKKVPQENIRTYAFIGHSQLLDNPSKKCDKKAIIWHFVPSSMYQEYLLHQSDHLLLKGAHQDIDHLVLETEISNIASTEVEKLWDFLKGRGYRYQLTYIEGIKRFGVHCPSFFSINRLTRNLNLPIESDFVEKIRFVFLEKEHKLLCVPMVFPKLYIKNADACPININVELPFELPCQIRGKHSSDKLCYLSVCLLIDALLARKFLCELRQSSEQYRIFEKIRVKRSDLVRYLGQDVGERVAEQIEHFLKQDFHILDEVIESDSSCFKVFLSSLPFSQENISAILHHLRKGYEEAVESNNDDPVDIKYTKPVEFLLTLGEGIHPLVFTEMLDELCDLGVIVPVSEYIEKERCWRRTYRTGEGNHDRWAWERSKYIVALAIQTLDPNGVPRMYLEKAMANFIYDYPTYLEEPMKNYLELHCFTTKPSYWGAQVFAIPPLSGITIPLSPKELRDETHYKKWQELATYFEFDEKTEKFSSRSPLKNVSRYIDPLPLQAYFRFIAHLKEETGKVDALNILSLCRNQEWFYCHLMYNIERWKKQFELFLRNAFDKNYLNEAAKMAASAEQKINGLKDFPRIMEKCQQIADSDPITFEKVWAHIKCNTQMNYSWIENDKFTFINDVIKAIRALDGMIRLKLNLAKPEKKKKILRRVLECGPLEFSKIGIDIDTENFLKRQYNNKELYQILSSIYFTILRKVGELPTPDQKTLIDKIKERMYHRLLNYYEILPPERALIRKMIEECFRYLRENFGAIEPKCIEFQWCNDKKEAVITIEDAMGERFKAHVTPERIKRIKKIT